MKHIGHIRTLPCLVCGKQSSAHHVTATRYGVRIARSDDLTVPLCPYHHQIIHNPVDSVEALGHGSFASLHGIDLLAWAVAHAPEGWKDRYPAHSLAIVERALEDLA